MPHGQAEGSNHGKEADCGGLLACEQVIFENGTMNCTPVNCFVRRSVARVPSEPLSFYVLAFLTDGVGDVELDLVIERLDTLEGVHRRTATLRFGDSLREYRYLIHVRDCIFPVQGGYQILLFADGESIAQRKLVIELRGDVP
jgi:hypothetical protein